MKKVLSTNPEIEFWYGDFLSLAEDIPKDSIDLVVTDPPYNLKRFEHNDDLSDEEFKVFTLRWLNELYRVLKTGHLLFFTFWSDGMYEMYQTVKKNGV
jgi:DNA modification methylase